MSMAVKIEEKKKRKTPYDLFKDKIEFLNNNVDNARVYIKENYMIQEEENTQNEIDNLEEKLEEHNNKYETVLSSLSLDEYLDNEKERIRKLDNDLKEDIESYNKHMEGLDNLAIHQYIQRFKPDIEKHQETVKFALELYNLEMDSYNNGEYTLLEEVKQNRSLEIEKIKSTIQNLQDKLDQEENCYFELEKIWIEEIKNTNDYGRLCIKVTNKVIQLHKELEGVTLEEAEKEEKEGWELDDYFDGCGYYNKEEKVIEESKEFITPFLAFEYRDTNKKLTFRIEKEMVNIGWKEKDMLGDKIEIYFNNLNTPLNMIDLDKEW